MFPSSRPSTDLPRQALDSRLTRLLCCIAIVASMSFGCGDDGDTSTAPEGTTTQELPDGTTLSIPIGSTYWYSHVEVSGGTGQWAVPQGPGRLVVSRIDWSFCNPKSARLEFVTAFGDVLPPYTWRVPTTVETPLAGISILGIFSGNNLEGGLRVPLWEPGGGTDLAIAYRVTSCDGDWVSLYGYYTLD